MTWVIAILSIYLEEQLQIRRYVIKHLILQETQSMMDINVDLLQQFTYFSIKRMLSLQINLLLIHTKQQELIRKTNNCLKKYTSHLSKNLRKEKYTQLLQIISGVLI